MISVQKEIDYCSEEWKDIPGYEGLYQASTLGRVKRLSGYQCKKERILNGTMNKDGYISVHLRKNGTEKCLKMHRVIAATFLENPLNKETVNHIDCDKTNNRLDNLEWATYKEQGEHAARHGRVNITEYQKNCVRAALQKRVYQYTLSGEFIQEYESVKKAAETVGCKHNNISRVCNGIQKTACGFVWKFKEDCHD